MRRKCIYFQGEECWIVGGSHCVGDASCKGKGPQEACCPQWMQQGGTVFCDQLIIDMYCLSTLDIYPRCALPSCFSDDV